MKKLLIVSPHFPPSSTADSQRVRMLLPFFREHGWEPVVLAVEPKQVAAPQDQWLVGGLPKDIRIVRVTAMGLGWSRIPGLGVLDYRALPALRRAGDALLGSESFDLVYFSTTVFGVHVLGPRWKRRYGVPFVLDYQDPWVSDYYREHPDIRPPGGRLKYNLMQAKARRDERRVLAACAGITSVSPDYPRQLKEQYPWLADFPALVQPFPGSRADFERLEKRSMSPSDFGLDWGDTKRNWVYVGVVGPYMHFSLTALFLAIARWRKEAPEQVRGLRLHFVGTSYAPAGTAEPAVLPLARRFGLDDVVHEQTDRLPLSKALQLLLSADALIVPGSDDAAYTASKIYPYLLARKPLLVVFHRQSSVVNLIEEAGGGVVVGFGGNETPEELAGKIYRAWLQSGAYYEAKELNEEAFAPYMEKESAKQLCGFLCDLIDTM